MSVALDVSVPRVIALVTDRARAFHASHAYLLLLFAAMLLGAAVSE